MKRAGCFLLAIMMLGALMLGCQSTVGSGEEQNPSTTESEQKIVYAMSGEPQIMDPGLNYYLAPSNLLQNLFRGLYKLDENGNTVPCIATGYTLDETETIYTFTLRDDTKWSDGQPLDAYDFEFAWKRVIDPAVGSSTAYAMDNIKNAQACSRGELPMDEVGIKALDATTLQVTLEAPTSWFIDLVATPNFMPLREDVVAIDGWSTSADTYVCNGPFMITEMLPKEKYVMEKNPNYFDAENVKLETIEVIFMESAESTLIAYNNGDVDFTENISAEAKVQYLETSEYIASPKIGITFFDFNCEREPFNDARVRKAFSMAISRQDILDFVLESPEEAAYAYVPNGYYNPADRTQSYRETVGNDLIEENVDEAKRLLEEAGYPGGQGMLEIELVVGTSQQEKDLAQALQSMWKDNLGVEVRIVTYESKVLSEQADLGNFSIISDGWTGLYPDPMSIMQSQSALLPEDVWTRWVNDEYNTLLTNSISELDQEQRMNDFKRMEEILIDEMPILPLYYRSNLYLCKPNIKNVIKNLLGHTYLEYAYVE